MYHTKLFKMALAFIMGLFCVLVMANRTQEQRLNAAIRLTFDPIPVKKPDTSGHFYIAAEGGGSFWMGDKFSQSLSVQQSDLHQLLFGEFSGGNVSIGSSGQPTAANIDYDVAVEWGYALHNGLRFGLKGWYLPSSFNRMTEQGTYTPASTNASPHFQASFSPQLNDWAAMFQAYYFMRYLAFIPHLYPYIGGGAGIWIPEDNIGRLSVTTDSGSQSSMTVHQKQSSRFAYDGVVGFMYRPKGKGGLGLEYTYLVTQTPNQGQPIRYSLINVIIDYLF